MIRGGGGEEEEEEDDDEVKEEVEVEGGRESGGEAWLRVRMYRSGMASS